MALWKIELTASSPFRTEPLKYRTIIEAECFDSARNGAIAEAPSPYFRLTAVTTEGQPFNDDEYQHVEAIKARFLSGGAWYVPSLKDKSKIVVDPGIMT
jgi:hypothetical protein